MGDSEKIPDVRPHTYRFTTHRDHLWAFIDAVIGLQEKVLLGVMIGAPRSGLFGPTIIAIACAASP